MDSEDVITTCLVRMIISNLIVESRFVCFRYATCSAARSYGGLFLSGD